MMLLRRFVLLVCVGILHCIPSHLYAAANNSFIVEMSTDTKKIGDIKPVFIVYKDKELPKVSINYVLKRYIKLFETAKSPDVRIDALNRINNLRAKYKLTSKKLTIDNVKQSEVVLDSYDRIVDSGVFYQRMDELLYQTAKATNFIGNEKESVRRLKMLVGLYPRSGLVDESMFRMAESYFDLEQYAKAEAAYKKILVFSQEDTFHQQSRFKLAWSAFKLKQLEEASKVAIDTLDYYPSLLNQISFSDVEESEQDLVEDTLRLLAIIFSKQKNAESIETLQKKIGHSHYAFLLYDALFRLYLRQDRFEEGALAAHAYTQNYPSDFNAYSMADNAIKTYKKGKFDIQEWAEKEYFVKNFGIHSPYWAGLSAEQTATVKPFVVFYLEELAHLNFVRMQKSVKAKDGLYREYALQSADYYTELVSTNPDYQDNGQYLYLAAEALNTAAETPADYLQVIAVYERAAYEQNSVSIAASSGYAAILTYDALKNKDGMLPAELVKARQNSIERYAGFFPADPNTPDLLNDLANELFNSEDYAAAQAVAAQVVEYASAKPEVLYSSWLVKAHSSFELQQYNDAEFSYQKALALNSTKNRQVLRERLAASIYKQAESTNDLNLSADLFLKVVDTIPESSIVPQSLYDASSQLLMAGEWSKAIATLNHFQNAFPEHALFDEASEKLIFAYTESGEFISAAEKLVFVSSRTQNRETSSNYLYRAADLYFTNGFEYEGIRLYEQFATQFTEAFDLNIEAQHLIISFNEQSGQTKAAQDWRRRLVNYEKKFPSKRNDRSAYLASKAGFSLAMDNYQEFEELQLTLPLKQSLQRKKQLLTNVVKEFESLVGYDVAEIVSASTYQIGQVYRTLAQDLMRSERPTSLNELQLEQYNILLEEQAYPFEEQALDIFKINIAKVPDGQYDLWIKRTYEVLEEMNPTEFKRQFKEVSHARAIY